MIIYLRLLNESFSFALNALRNNKLRTFLSLLGVTIGIFSIIAVLTAVDSLDRKIEKELSSLDKNTIYLMNRSFAPSDIPQWKRDQFPNMKYEEYLMLRNNLSQIEHTAFQAFVKSESIKYGSQTVSGVSVVPASNEIADINGVEVVNGRFYNESESNSGSALIVLGDEIAKSLFDNVDPVGKNVRLYGQRFTVIGVMKKRGKGIFGNEADTSVYIPVNFIRRLFGVNNEDVVTVVVLKPVQGVDIESLKGEITYKLRNLRGLKAGEIDDFFINVFSGLTNFIDNIIRQMNLVGWIISGFSLLVGGFGIANIMFVSVKERTNIIGIQKSLGAQNRFILLQFLFEAMILSVIGGTIGLLLVLGISVLLTNLLDFEFVLGLKNILLGTGLSAIIGLISGIWPAVSASKLDPVEAIRTGM